MLSIYITTLKNNKISYKTFCKILYVGLRWKNPIPIPDWKLKFPNFLDRDQLTLNWLRPTDSFNWSGSNITKLVGSGFFCPNRNSYTHIKHSSVDWLHMVSRDFLGKKKSSIQVVGLISSYHISSQHQNITYTKIFFIFFSYFSI